MADDLKKLMEDNQEETDLFVAAGLPGCLAWGYSPGKTGGMIRKSTPLEEKLSQLLLVRLRKENEPAPVLRLIFNTPE